MQNKALQPNFVTGKMHDDGGYVAATVTFKPKYQKRYLVTDTSMPSPANKDAEVQTRTVEITIGACDYHALLPIETDVAAIEEAIANGGVKTTKDKNGKPALARVYVPKDGFFEEIYVDPRMLTTVATASAEDKIDYRRWGNTRTTLSALSA